MPKPRRKHPAFGALELSLQGRQFLRFLESAVGDDVRWRPVGSTRDRFHVFEVKGSRDHVFLVEAPARTEDGLSVIQAGFRHDLNDFGLVSQVEVVIHRIDPWVWANATGDKTLVNMPDRARRREADRRSSTTGNASDTITSMLLPASEAPAQLGGLAWEQVEALIEEGARREGPQRRTNAAADAVACPVCGRLCTREEAASHLCDRIEFSDN